MATERVTISTDPGAPASGTPAPAAGDPRPTWLPEKFKTAEEFAKSYGELEAKLGQKPADSTTTTPASPNIPTTPQQVKDAAQKAGIDLAALSQEYVTNGNKLTAESLKMLNDKGIPQSSIDNYIVGVQANASAIVSEITAVAGGSKELSTIYQWAEANLPKEEIEAYNSIMDGGNKIASKLAFEGLYSRFRTASGKDPSLVSGDSTPATTGVKPFESSAQITEAMRNPKYESDPAYRDEVYKRMNVTSVFGR